MHDIQYMRTHTYWKTYEEYLKWSYRDVHRSPNSSLHETRVHIKFID